MASRSAGVSSSARVVVALSDGAGPVPASLGGACAPATAATASSRTAVNKWIRKAPIGARAGVMVLLQAPNARSPEWVPGAPAAPHFDCAACCQVPSLHREIEIRAPERLVAEREVPPFLDVAHEAAPPHRVGEQRTVA